jgi:hypothetical protein
MTGSQVVPDLPSTSTAQNAWGGAASSGQSSQKKNQDQRRDIGDQSNRTVNPGPKVPQFNWGHKNERDKEKLIQLCKSAERQSAIIPSYSHFLSSPLFIEARWPLNIIFLRSVFSRLVPGQIDPGSAQAEINDQVDDRPQSSGEKKLPPDVIPYPVFERAIERIFKALGIDAQGVDFKKYDVKKKGDDAGYVGWREFCRCWRDCRMATHLDFVERLYLCFDPLGGGASKISRIISQIVLLCIALSVLSFVLCTQPDFRYIPETCSFCEAPDAPEACMCEPKPYEIFHSIELVCAVIFSVELLMRFATCWAAKLELFKNDALLEALCTEDPDGPTSSPQNRLLIFTLDPSNILDFLAILPFYFEFLGLGSNLMVLRLMRLSRAFRVLRRGKLQYAQELVVETLAKSKMSMYMVTFYLMLGILMSSCLVYFSEMGEWDEAEQVYMWPDKYGVLGQSPFTSIPETCWWTIVTVTAVGYGDYQPSTPLGKFFGSVTIIAGAIVFAMPIGIISSNFTHVWSEHEAKERAFEDQSGEHNRSAILEVLNGYGMDGRTQVRFEVWDYDGACDEPEFLGCAALDLAILGADQDSPLKVDQELPLVTDFTRSRRNVQGYIKVRLEWAPTAGMTDSPSSKGPGTQIQRKDVSCSAKIVEVGEAVYTFMDRPPTPQLKGQLTVDVVSARNLLNLDSRVQGCSDPFVHVIICPSHSSGHMAAPHSSWDTKVVDDCLNPVWNKKQTFALDWTRRGQISMESSDPQIGISNLTAEETEQLASEEALEFPVQRILELQKAIEEEIQRYESMRDPTTPPDKFEPSSALVPHKPRDLS